VKRGLTYGTEAIIIGLKPRARLEQRPDEKQKLGEKLDHRAFQ
jgi:hypothetical protein